MEPVRNFLDPKSDYITLGSTASVPYLAALHFT